MRESTKRVPPPGVNAPFAGERDDSIRELLFVPVKPQDGLTTSVPSRQTIRKHVMNQWARNRHREFPERVIPSTAEVEPGDMRKQLSRFRLKNGEPKIQQLKRLVAKSTWSPGRAMNRVTTPWISTQRLSQKQRPVQDPVSTYRRDPFTTFPIEADDETRSLFAFYLNDLNNKSISQNPTRDFIPIALSDAACFHILMATLLQVQRFQGRPGGPCFWYHRGKAIAALNEELSCQTFQITDVMFCTVGMLAYVETRVPNLRSETASLHLTALIKFLQLRKGILKLELYCMLLRLAIWCTINPPLVNPTLSSLNRERDFDFERMLPRNEHGVTPFRQDIFDDIKLLVHIKAELDLLPEEETEKKISFYEKFVSKCLSQASASLSASPIANFAQSTVIRSIQMSQILFLYNICPSMSISGVYCQSIAVALRACLEEASSVSEDSACWKPEILCWILVNGAITKQEKALQAWYLRRITEFRRFRGIHTFNELEVTLRKVAWIEDGFGSACRSIWDWGLTARVPE